MKTLLPITENSVSNQWKLRIQSMKALLSINKQLNTLLAINQKRYFQSTKDTIFIYQMGDMDSIDFKRSKQNGNAEPVTIFKNLNPPRYSKHKIILQSCSTSELVQDN